MILRLTAVGEGFEPPIPVRVYRISSPAHSSTLPSHLIAPAKVVINFHFHGGTLREKYIHP